MTATSMARSAPLPLPCSTLCTLGPTPPRQQAEHMMDMAECKDDRLTLDLMLSVLHAFYGVIQAHHDEL